MAVPPPQESGYQLWYHYPSVPGNIVFAVLFLILSITHLIGLTINGMKFCVPLLIGGIFEIIGYALRVVCHYSPNSVSLYAAQSLLILLAPILFAASVYMYLGRLMIATNTTTLSPIPTKWLTKLFVTGDVVCFLAQAAGGGMQAGAKSETKMDTAENVILVGLCLQIVFTCGFVVVAGIVHKRMGKQGLEGNRIAWKRLMVVLYIASGLIIARNTFRAVEYGLGSDGYLHTHEWTGYAFDGAPMILVLVVTTCWYIGGGSKLRAIRGGYSETVQLKSAGARI